MTELNQEEFDAAVKAKVDEILSSKEEAQARAEAEAALKEAREMFEALKASIEAKDAKIKEYEEALANLDTSEPTEAEVAANDKIVELEKELEETKRRADVAEAALDTLAREETAAGRMAELAEAGVSLDEEAAEAQYAKVRDMSEEEFASYKSELVALKSKYAASSSEEEKEEHVELAELSEQEINMIAQSLGCDPADSKCVSLVREVAQKVSDVSKQQKSKMAKKKAKCAEEAVEEEAEEGLHKEKASEEKKPLGLSEAIMKSVNQELTAPAGLKEECETEWNRLYAEKRGEKSE